MPLQGGCLKNMMESEDSGTLSKGHSIRDKATNWLPSLKKSSTRCLRISSLMGNYGTSTTPHRTTLHHTQHNITQHKNLNSQSNHQQRFGRDNFKEATKLSNRSKPREIDWSNFKYMVFDIPNHQGTYSDCYALLSTPCLLSPQTSSKKCIFYIHNSGALWTRRGFAMD